MFPGQGCQIGQGHGGMEAHDAVVGGVYAHEGAGILVDSRSVVVQVTAVGGAHFAQAGTAFFHHFRDAEAAADLHQFPARDDDLAALAEGIQHQQDGGGVIVDHHGGLGAGQALEQLVDDDVAAAASAAVQVELQVAVAGDDPAHGLLGTPGQHGTSHVGMDDHAGAVDDITQARRRLAADEGQQLGQTGLQGQFGGILYATGADVVAAAVPEIRDGLAQQGAGQVVQGLVRRQQGIQTGVHGRQGTEKVVHASSLAPRAEAGCSSRWG